MTDTYRNTENLRFFSLTKLAEQQQREADLVKAGKDRYDKRLGTKTAIDTAPGLKLVEETFQAVIDRITKSKAQQIAAGRGRKRGWFKLLKDVDTEIMAWQALAGSLNAAKSFQNHTSAALYIGRQLAAHLQLEAMEQDEPDLVRQHEKYARKHNRDDVRTRKMAKLAKNFGYFAPAWDDEDCIVIGEFLMGEVEGSTELTHTVKVKKSENRVQLRVAFKDDEQEEWNKAHDILAMMLPMALPMLVPPKPWTNNTDGGLVHPHKNVKLLNEASPVSSGTTARSPSVPSRRFRTRPSRSTRA
jgi:DNA-directed RNA polymerase